MFRKSGGVRVMPSKSFKPNSMLTRNLSCVPALAILFSASNALAAAPAVVADAQQTIGSNYSNPQSVAVAPNGTVYVADTNNNRVVALTTNLPGTSAQSTVNAGGLTSPQALAVDAKGDLYIADTPILGLFGRVIEVVANSSGVLTNTVNQIYFGGLLTTPISLAIDSANTLFIGESELLGTGAIYSLPSGGTTPHKLNITGLPFAFTPSALVRDASSNLYFANSASTDGGVYVAPMAGGAAHAIAAGSFVIREPSGLALDGSGDLFILSLLGSGNGPNAGQQVVEIPAASPSTPYIIPTSNLQISSSMTLDPSGNLDVAEIANGGNGNGLVTQLNFLNPVDLGSVGVFQAGTAVVFNFEFNAPATLSGFRAVTVGDLGAKSDVVQGSSGNCKNQTLSGTTAYLPYTCDQTFEATPQYTGSRVSAIQVKGSGSAILDSSAVYETGLSAAQITYPLDVTTTAIGLVQPQGLAISGFDQTVYVADLANGVVYSASGVNGSSLKAVSTGAITLQAPSAVAMNGEGDLYIADFNLGEVIVVPTTTGKASFVVKTGGLLQHPISLALDFLGDLYIGDAGSDGDGASGSNPGYVVELPYNGPAFKVPTPTVSVIFPQALATDSINGNLWIGDGGDVSTGIGQMVKVPADGSNASIVSVTGVAQPTDPTGLAFDAAENLYVLDGVAGTITVVPPAGASQLLGFNNTSLSVPSALASSAGSQSFVVANVGGMSNSLIYLNGNSSTLAFGNVPVNGESATQMATVVNIGNQTLTLSSPYYSVNKTVAAFDLQNSTTCKPENLNPAKSCSFNLQFDPTSAVAFSQQVIINSNAYNNGIPLINLSGTGTAAAVANFKASLKLNTGQPGRKSFQAAGRKAHTN
jgi:sugar lactone lactonase YvrE